MASLRTSLLRSSRALLVILVLLLTGAAFASEAAAIGTWLCSGYSGCVAAGYSDAGYGAASGTSYWGMYPGHNCTNYAAYRLIKNGVDASYLQGQGNAYQWGGVAQSHGVAVDGTPRVGDIAWWAANSGGTGEDGHVAYVEQVGNGYIITSEDNYGGDFHWVKLTPGGYYPTGFIHFGGATYGGASWAPTQSFDYKDYTFLGADHVGLGGVMYPGQYIMSATAEFALVLRYDGDLALYGGLNSTLLWESHTEGNANDALVLQSGDGNLVMYNPGSQAIWASGTNGGNVLALQLDGNVVIYNSSGTPLWASNTAAGVSFRADNTWTNYLPAGGSLPHYAFIESSDGRYVLLVQGNGDVELYGPGYSRLWHTNTAGNPNDELVMQSSDGNLVLYNPGGQAIWASNTNGPGSIVALQTDGNLVIYAPNGSATWASGT